MKTTVDVKTTTIGVVGAGSWGTALANLLAVKGFAVDHWVYEAEVKAQMLEKRENQRFLPGVTLSDNLHPSGDLESVVAGKDMVLVVTPSHVTRRTIERCGHAIGPDTVVVSASKGIENQTHLTMSGVLAEVIPGLSADRLAVLTGPSFAKEVARQMATVVTVASNDTNSAAFVQQVFVTPYFRVYTIDDLIGAELGAAVKNVIAIAAGVIDGLGLGLNTRAALITRGLVEIRRLGLAMGAQPRTFTGLAGVGDLILTCTGDLSRNHTIGKQIGEGKKLKDLLAEMHMVAEGVKTARSVYNLSRERDVEMPISHAVYHVLYDDLDPKTALYQLMTRDLKQELDET
ncbi:NAD(P)H-dependent glycerol-3-phosphate dehydrogenase [Desulfosarcina sp.]|uniref:NAD(P)H-dependent glycerol-3-phosphate dehydrogenase n=1 Tax=Desulfosarcina sp. TaxID=2027861 RepID=UPI0029B7FF52|nr:NAD(P)H-dependent glycerol-3-phosphate dehydrogenase [Desulfosarcina sp.]MDX2453139.1 NAD(P)H-dependent glycerol-3-phosphate dehydrogenase [Desulfosarcina sp.]MDX2490868.1 NAD(P)H-dependent glycerol-3-phosphate dehydrogenase [Desulfosarcina sp.]